MEAITASLERSLQNCSLNSHQSSSSSSSRRRRRRRRRKEDLGSSATKDISDSGDGDGDGDEADSVGIGISSTSSDDNHVSNFDTTLELNSHVSLPYHWEQCLDLKTGEIYYINWRNGMKAKEDPRKAGEYGNSMMSRDYESSEEEGEESWYDSQESSSESCPSSSKKQQQQQHFEGQIQKHNNNNSNNNMNNMNNNNNNNNNNSNNVLVVAGCKSCLMYFMVPKQVEDCPKCSGQLLHFDRSENGSP